MYSQFEDWDESETKKLTLTLIFEGQVRGSDKALLHGLGLPMTNDVSNPSTINDRAITVVLSLHILGIDNDILYLLESLILHPTLNKWDLYLILKEKLLSEP